MLQVEIKVNGCLVDYLNVVNVGRFDVSSGDNDCAYRIEHGGKSYRCRHRREDGALVLVAKAIGVINLSLEGGD